MKNIQRKTRKINRRNKSTIRKTQKGGLATDTKIKFYLGDDRKTKLKLHLWSGDLNSVLLKTGLMYKKKKYDTRVTGFGKMRRSERYNEYSILNYKKLSRSKYDKTDSEEPSTTDFFPKEGYHLFYSKQTSKSNDTAIKQDIYNYNNLIKEPVEYNFKDSPDLYRFFFTNIAYLNEIISIFKKMLAEGHIKFNNTESSIIETITELINTNNSFVTKIEAILENAENHDDNIVEHDRSAKEYNLNEQIIKDELINFFVTNVKNKFEIDNGIRQFFNDNNETGHFLIKKQRVTHLNNDETNNFSDDIDNTVSKKSRSSNNVKGGIRLLNFYDSDDPEALPKFTIHYQQHVHFYINDSIFPKSKKVVVCIITDTDEPPRETDELKDFFQMIFQYINSSKTGSYNVTSNNGLSNLPTRQGTIPSLVNNIKQLPNTDYFEVRPNNNTLPNHGYLTIEPTNETPLLSE